MNNSASCGVQMSSTFSIFTILAALIHRITQLNKVFLEALINSALLKLSNI
jgi:hypothetical protein